ncbi:FkbM family methyltransferase [Mycolicibacterium sp. P9-64]|uniref:FkbM family methyltransferase n=1 Tax=Mycolicibacterium sp. P9-64 TaxID=2024612 RepID=UPI0011EEE2F3|nr:FkbM family methyltransferase [Mycolicibacterium sp. P9-64]
MSVNDLAWKLLPWPMLARIAFWRKYWLYGEWEMRELRRLLPDRPGLVVDVGANRGYYSYALRRLGRRVISFEPDRAYQKRLQALLGSQGRIEMVALSSNAGIGVMRVPYVGGAYGGSLGSLSDLAVPDEAVSSCYQVELSTLDSYGLDDVAFIKIDVEGHEESVLAGANNTLIRAKPVLLIEIEERHNPGGLDRIATKLSHLGYSGSFFYERKKFALSQFVPEVHQVAERVTVGETNRRDLKYVNNFVFKVT